MKIYEKSMKILIQEYFIFKLTGCAKALFQSRFVIPAEAGIQSFQGFLGSRFRGSDGSGEFSASC